MARAGEDREGEGEGEVEEGPLKGRVCLEAALPRGL